MDDSCVVVHYLFNLDRGLCYFSTVAASLHITHLLVVGEFDGLDLLRAVLVVVEVVLHGERLHQLHRRLRANLNII